MTDKWMNRAGRAFLGLVAATVTAGTLTAAGQVWADIADHLDPAHTTAMTLADSLALDADLWGLCLAVAAVPVLVLGLPVFLLLNAVGKVRWWTSAPAGALIGAATYVGLSSLASLNGYIAPSQYAFLAEFAGIGAAGALVAWRIWRTGNRPADVS